MVDPLRDSTKKLRREDFPPKESHSIPRLYGLLTFKVENIVLDESWNRSAQLKTKSDVVGLSWCRIVLYI